MMQRGGDQQISVAAHIYRYTLRSPRVFLSFIISYPLALVTIFVVNGLFPPHHFGLDPFATIGSLVGIGVGLVLITVRTTLTITPDGVLYQRPGRSTWVVWSDIEAVRPWSRGYYGWISGEGLVIRANALSPSGSPKRRTFSRSFIPLECFAPRWRESPLGEDVRRDAPWLFAEANPVHR